MVCLSSRVESDLPLVFASFFVLSWVSMGVEEMVSKRLDTWEGYDDDDRLAESVFRKGAEMDVLDVDVTSSLDVDVYVIQ